MRASSSSLAFLLCTGAVGGGVGVGMPLCQFQCLGTNTAVEGTCEKATVLSVNEQGCAFCVLQAGKLSFMANTAKQRPKHKAALPFKMILVIFKHDLLYL